VLTISSIVVSGNASDFPQTHTCGGSLAAGASCTISMKFQPTAKGARTATLAVTDNAIGSPHKVTVSGTDFNCSEMSSSAAFERCGRLASGLGSADVGGRKRRDRGRS